MRRVAIGLTAFITLTVLAPPAASLASVERHTNSDWRGTTEQGGDVKMVVVRTQPGGPWIIPSWNYTITFFCANGDEGTTQFGYFGSDFQIIDGDAGFETSQIFWTGHFSHENARGTVQYTNDHTHCDSGLLTWTAAHLHPPG